MTATVLPGLVVDIEGRVDKLEKAMSRANDIQRRGSRSLEARARQSAQQMERAYTESAARIGKRMESMVAPFMRGGVVFAGVAAAAGAVKQIADSIAEVDREARKAGVSAKVWQQWSYVATATGASVDGVTDALKELNIRGDEFARTGKGSAAEWFDRLGYSAEEVSRKLQDPNRLMDELIGKIQRLDRASQTRALDELFGGQGQEQLAKVLGLSVQEIQRLRSEAATFSEEQIEAAKKIDREWETMWRNFTIYAKKAAIESVGVLGDLKYYLGGHWLPGYDDQQKALAYYSSDEFKLKQAQKQREQLIKDISNVKADPALGGVDLGVLDALEKELQAVEEQIISLGGGSDELKQALKELSAITQRAGGAFDGSASSASNFKSALEALNALVPDLKAELDELGKLDAVDAAFGKAFDNASNLDDLISAGNIAARARSAARYGVHSNILDLIGAAEGTDKGRGYNETLAYGKFTGGAVNLTGMTLNQVLALQKSMLAHPDNNFNSSAVGRYQITRRTLLDMMGELGLTGDRLFNEDTQDELARALLRRRGNDVAGLRHEWEGLRNVDDETIRNAYQGTPVAAQQLAPTDQQQRQIELTRQQTEARQRLNDAIQQGLERAQFEQSISGMSENQRRVELELYDRVAEARRNGITLSDNEIASMREKIALTNQLTLGSQQAAASQNALQQAGMFFGQQFTSSLSGLLTGTMSVTDAVRNLANALIDASLQAMFLGQGPLAALFGTAGGGGLFGAIFGFADGGWTGPGSKYQPAGIVHADEYVMTKETTRRIGVPTLDALNYGGSLPGFDRGGYVGDAPAVRRVHAPANQNATPAVQAFNINAPITVQGSAGTPQQNADLAKRMRKEMEATMRGLIADEIRQQRRPGNMLNNPGL